ncbi:hypothetical protein TOPH_06952 [Tolypocladium ophioglossoides CBS 100239]|uniref:Uncharacterized protein n=1 Tax=Tolypocladium ophioglossoides (strain CBS 100239) TaxID=1163406 RepID=A0A0L0N2K2_TOLOC|nr:hypothetical protein TOPH_06952 [Tolypocladium ophioglossoides CBS 100239]
MTSSGHVTMPEVKPPMAPAMALNCESEARTAHFCNGVKDPGWCIGVESAASRRYEAVASSGDEGTRLGSGDSSRDIPSSARRGWFSDQRISLVVGSCPVSRGQADVRPASKPVSSSAPDPWHRRSTASLILKRPRALERLCVGAVFAPRGSRPSIRCRERGLAWRTLRGTQRSHAAVSVPA